MVATLTDLTRRLNFSGAFLPPLFLLTDDQRLPDPRGVLQALPRGSAVIFRNYEDPARERLARLILEPCRRRGIRFLVAGDPRLAVRIGADGIHFPEGALRRDPGHWRLWCRPGWLITAAAHSPGALAAARCAGVDAVLLSPVFPTLSHPGAPVIGPQRFALWCRRAGIPVYALGGISVRHARRLANSGAAGFAGIKGIC